MANKGSSFEREISKQLSLWWTYGEREDVFWRSQASGARATQRKKQGKNTFGQVGDITSTDPISQPFVDLFTIELKKGYGKDTFADVMDLPPHRVQSTFEGFIEICMLQRTQAMTPYWLLIFQRVQRIPLIYMPKLAAFEIFRKKNMKMPTPRIMMHINVRSSIDKTITVKQGVFGTTLEQFLTLVKPEMIIKLAKEIK